ncbi:MAG: fatty acid desaturase [Myxococcota bacterium]|jgi:fatty acid desaturase
MTARITPTSGPLTAEQVRQFSARSSLTGAFHLGMHLGLAVVLAALLWRTWGSLWTPVLWCAVGVVINYLYAAQHELSHGTVFTSRRANELWGRVIGLLMLYPRDYDRHHHLRHHRYTGDPDQDAELAFRTPYTFRSYVLYGVGVTYWWGRMSAIWACARGQFDAYERPATVARKLTLEARIHLAIYAGIAVVSAATGSWLALLVWLGPMLTLKWTHQVQNTVEHTGMAMTADLWNSTRTVRAPAPWRWLVWNMTFHTAHHAYPSVPFFRLPHLHSALVDTAGPPQTVTYLEFQRWVLGRLWKQPEANGAFDAVSDCRSPDATPGTVT